MRFDATTASSQQLDRVFHFHPFRLASSFNLLACKRRRALSTWPSLIAMCTSDWARRVKPSASKGSRSMSAPSSRRKRTASEWPANTAKDRTVALGKYIMWGIFGRSVRLIRQGDESTHVGPCRLNTRPPVLVLKNNTGSCRYGRDSLMLEACKLRDNGFKTLYLQCNERRAFVAYCSPEDDSWVCRRVATLDNSAPYEGRCSCVPFSLQLPRRALNSTRRAYYSYVVDTAVGPHCVRDEEVHSQPMWTGFGIRLALELVGQWCSTRTQ